MYTDCWKGGDWQVEALDGGRLRVLREGTTRGGLRSRGFVLHLAPALVRHPEGWMLVDPGLEPAWIRGEEDLEFQPPESGLRQQLAERGLEPGEIGDVVLSHLDGDHASGLYDDEAEGSLFPGARVHVQRRALDWWEHRFRSKRRVRYLHRRVFDALLACEDLVIHEGTGAPARGILLRQTDGHTPGHQVTLVGEERPLVLGGDLLSTRASFREGVVADADHDAETADRQRRELLSEPASGWFLYHGLPGRRILATRTSKETEKNR